MLLHIAELLKSSDLSLIFIPHQAIFRMIPKDEICKLPSDENTVDKRTEKLWKFFKKSEKGENLIDWYLCGSSLGFCRTSVQQPWQGQSSSSPRKPR